MQKRVNWYIVDTFAVGWDTVRECESRAMQTQVSKFVEKLKRIHLSRLFVLLIFGLINVTPRFRHILRKPCCTKNEHRNLICFLEYNDMHLLYWFKFCFRQRLFPKENWKATHTVAPLSNHLVVITYVSLCKSQMFLQCSWILNS
jgi:hypothetical protein